MDDTGHCLAPALNDTGRRPAPTLNKMDVVHLNELLIQQRTRNLPGQFLAPWHPPTSSSTYLLLCICLDLTPAKIKNPSYATIFATQAVLEQVLISASLTFAPGLLNILKSTLPPTIAYFKSLPALKHDDAKRWAVYLLVLERKGLRPRIYVGSGTNTLEAVHRRFRDHDKKRDLPKHVIKALEDGYEITHKGLLCTAPIPDIGLRYPIVGLFLLLETYFSIAFWAMKPRTKDYGMPHLCPWPIELLEYNGLCSHTALAEAICGELDGLSPEERAAKEVELNNRRLEQQRASNKARYHKLKTEDYPKWLEQRRQHNYNYYHKKEEDPVAWKEERHRYAANLDPVAKAVSNKKSRAKAVVERRFACELCGVSFQQSTDLEIHKKTQKHKDKVGGVQKDPTGNKHRAAKRFYCCRCDFPAPSQVNLDRHYGTKKHIKAAKAAEAALKAL